MSTINSIGSFYSQSVNSLYKNAHLIINSSDSSSTGSSSSVQTEDSLTISSEGLNLLKAAQETQKSDTEDEETSNNSTEQDVISQLEELSSSDQLSEDQKAELDSIIEKLKEKLDSTDSTSSTSEDSKSTEKTDKKKPMMPPPPPPMEPMNIKLEDILEEDEDEEDSDSDTISTEETTSTSSYPMNFDSMVSSGFMTQEQANTIMSAYNTANE